MGFLHPVHDGLLNKLGLELDTRQNIKVNGDFLPVIPKYLQPEMQKTEPVSSLKQYIREGRQQTRSIDISGLRKISRSEGKREGGKEGWRDGETEGKRERARGRRGEGVRGRMSEGRGGERAKEGKKNRNSEKLNTKKLENRKP